MVNPNKIIYKNETYHNLTATGILSVDKWGCTTFEMKCVCGKKVFCSFGHLKNGVKKACSRACDKRILPLYEQFPKEYSAWKNMKKRCKGTDPEDKRNYVDRNIFVSKEFEESFEVFLKHVGVCPDPKFSLDRIDNDLEGGYCRGNLRWTDSRTQKLNKRSCKRYQPLINKLKDLLGIDYRVKKLLVPNKTPPNLTGTRIHETWSAIRRRCFNENHPAFLNYGGRGITVHEDFQRSYYAFLSHVGEPPDDSYTLDRIDNDGDYTYNNLRWVKRGIQNNNRRTVAHSEKIIEDLKKQCDEKGISYEGAI